jgi:hypothetical protein
MTAMKEKYRGHYNEPGHFGNQFRLSKAAEKDIVVVSLLQCFFLEKFLQNNIKFIKKQEIISKG